MKNQIIQYARPMVAAGTALAMSVGNVLAIDYGDTEITPQKGFATDFGRLLNSVISFVMVIAALLVFLYLIWGGIEWITSGGDSGKTEKARNKITAAVIGLIVLAASYAILLLALQFLGFSSLDQVFDSANTISDIE